MGKTMMGRFAMPLLAACGALVFTTGADAAPRGDAAKWDPRMAAENASVDTNGVKWIDGRYLPIEGRMFDDVDHYYDRLPSNVSTNVNGGVRSMKHHTTGMKFRFRTDSKTLYFKWIPYHPGLAMDHMPSTGASGIDVYRRGKDGKWRFHRTGRIHDAAKGGFLKAPWKPEWDCLVNLPLYNGVKSFELGIDRGATVSALPPRKNGVTRPVVFYGTSITHGGCASRPGMSFVNIVGRELDVPVVNLGFSGSGRMELEMSEHLGRIDASCYVIDCVWNMNGPLMRANVVPFLKNLRRLRPDVPIICAAPCDVFCGTEPANSTPVRGREMREEFDKAVAAGVKGLHWLPTEDQLGGDYEGTVDGVHLNDWGMVQVARGFGAAIRRVLRK